MEILCDMKKRNNRHSLHPAELWMARVANPGEKAKTIA